jgi:DNA (cytosine-5)-methyltransferase 1
VLTGGSLFTGICGLDLAASLAGFDIRFQVEINEFCQKVIRKHADVYWPNATLHADVQGLTGLPYVDVLFGGFPCQDISNAGKRAGLVEGKRSSLWFEFARIIGEIRPRIVLLENVAGITTPRKGEDGEITPPDMALVIASLASLGYDARWGIISAADAGAPHQRNRWFCLAYASSERYLFEEATAESAYHEFGATQAQQFSGSSLSGSLESDGAILRGQGRLAYPYRQRFAEINGYRAKARKRAFSTGSMGNASIERLEGAFVDKQTSHPANATQSGRRQGFKSRSRAFSRMGRNANGFPKKLDGNRLMNHGWPARPNQPQFDYEPSRLFGTIPNRAKRIEALGNAVVPQVVYPIFKALHERLSAEVML